jgi:5'-3' exonuclease
MIYLIDASYYVFRSWFALPDTLCDRGGRPVNAVHGFARFLCDFIEQLEPERIAVAFDESLTGCFRNDLYPPYKSNRELPPAELEHQFGLCSELTRGLGVAALASRRYEADDIIGTLALRARRRGETLTIVSRDKDLAQLLGPGDALFDPASGRRVEYDGVRAWLGVRAEQVADFLALTGDAVDNIPGVPGIGKKTAAVLLAEFGSIAGLLADLQRVCRMPVRGAQRLADTLDRNRTQIALALRLTTIACDAPLASGLAFLRRGAPQREALHGLHERLRLGPALHARFGRLVERDARGFASMELFPRVARDHAS